MEKKGRINPELLVILIILFGVLLLYIAEKHIIMKKIKPLVVLLSLIIISISCETNDPAPNQVEGTYYGTLSIENQVTKISSYTKDAVAQVKITGDHELEVHCTSTDLDTIFRLNYFEHEENFKVCFTGDDFENMYHRAYSRPREMGMMNSGSEWMNHLNTMHEAGDLHYGEFNSNNQSFEYLFLMESGSHLQFMGYRGRN